MDCVIVANYGDKPIFLIYNSCIIIYLDFFSFTQEGTGVPCTPLCDLVALSFALYDCGLPSLRIPVTDLDFCAGVVEGLGWYGGFD